MDVLKLFIDEAKKLRGTVIFAEGDEERTLEAAVRLSKDGVCKSIVVGKTKEVVERAAVKKKLDISSVEVVVPSEHLLAGAALEGFLQRMTAKGMTLEAARQSALEPLNFSALYVKSGHANGCVAGARSSTADVLRAAIYGIGPGAGTKVVSSFFLMIPPVGHPLVKKPVVYADCGVNPDPGAQGLKDIAVASVYSYKSLFPSEKPRVAFLSFSTKGSAEHKSLLKIREAVSATREHFSGDDGVFVDGEMQFDAAAVDVVGQKKAPGSPVAGNANIFIFPDLNAGNICYKVTERLGLFTAIGPIIQGLAMPMNDLSRGCSVDDIYYVSVITLLKSRW
ncbi:MAG: hypothetical protein A2219_07435 [Elusimicrobia bacterium RIFOXYA2_FULL_50_26]|nr:MAG: hypothetical protein A2219_07435 [Elusimicrobia bacterium RIFOXYA2_FULL_50_26]OGS23125.1 MAG: hypothetical protein A2314_04795 [Elusimicrobia bacterium RIFOXYB2_FULL_50_12]